MSEHIEHPYCSCPKCQSDQALLGPDDPRIIAERWRYAVTEPVSLVRGSGDTDDKLLSDAVYWRAKATEAAIKLNDAEARLARRDDDLAKTWQQVYRLRRAGVALILSNLAWAAAAVLT